MTDSTFELKDLRSRVSGDLITPDDGSYDAARRLFYAGADRRPAAIVRVADATDVAAVLHYAKESGVDFAVRSGGHSVAWHSSVDGGVVIDLADLVDIDLDVEGHTVSAGTGLTALELTESVGEHGLAVGFGDTGSVGIGGITLGGGVGFLSRKHGLTIDSLISAEIVTADGEVLTADADTNPDLFWAIRGGGGNFGVATRFTYSLKPVDQVVGGMIILPATAESVARFVAVTQEAGEDLTTIANVMTCPPMPGVPEETVGSIVIMGLVVWCGDIEAGHQVMDRLRAIGAPVVDALGTMPYPDIYPPEDEEYQPLAFGLNGFTSGLDETKISTLLNALETSDAPLRVVQIRVLGGAVSRVPVDATAYAHRDREIMLNVASFYEGPADRARRVAWVENLFDTLTEDNAGYVGFLNDEGPERVRAAYPGQTWGRLREVKAKYDPANLFRMNQNIPPGV